MSYFDILKTRFGKKPVWLYEFITGPTRVFLNSSDKDVATVPGMFSVEDVFGLADAFHQVWTASSVSHDPITYSDEKDSSQAKLTFPQSDSFARQFLLPQGINPTTLTIRHMFLNDPDQEMFIKYRGEFTSPSPGEQYLGLNFESDNIDIGNKAFVRVVQKPCPYAVYFGGCRLDLAEWLSAAVVTVVDAKALTVPAASGQSNGFYVTGMLQWGEFEEMIVTHDGSNLTLIRSIPGLEDYVAANGSADVSIAPGCDLLLTTCGERFNNHLNYGGFNWMTDSPFDGSLV